MTVHVVRQPAAPRPPEPIKQILAEDSYGFPCRLTANLVVTPFRRHINIHVSIPGTNTVTASLSPADAAQFPSALGEMIEQFGTAP